MDVWTVNCQLSIVNKISTMSPYGFSHLRFTRLDPFCEFFSSGNCIKMDTQEGIPVGYVPPAVVAVCRGGVCPGGVSLGGVCWGEGVVWGVVCLGGVCPVGSGGVCLRGVYLGGWEVSAWGCLPGGVSTWRVSAKKGVGVSAWGVSAGGGVCSVVSARHPLPPWTEWLTDRCKNITLPQLRCGR